jgi:hypothetical protein
MFTKKEECRRKKEEANLFRFIPLSKDRTRRLTAAGPPTIKVDGFD